MESSNNGSINNSKLSLKQKLVEEVINKYKAKLNNSFSIDEFSKMSVSGSNIFDMNNYNTNANKIQTVVIEDKFNNKTSMNNSKSEEKQKISQVYKSIELLKNGNMIGEIFKLSEQALKGKSQTKDSFRMSFNKFQNIKSPLKIKTLSYLDSNDIYSFILTCIEFKNLITDHLLLVSKQIVNLFNQIYKRQLLCLKGYMTILKIKDDKGKRFVSNLVLICEIFSNKLIGNSISIPFLTKYFSDKLSFSNVFKFDVHSNNEILNYWVMREYTHVS